MAVRISISTEAELNAISGYIPKLLPEVGEPGRKEKRKVFRTDIINQQHQFFYMPLHFAFVNEKRDNSQRRFRRNTPTTFIGELRDDQEAVYEGLCELWEKQPTAFLHLHTGFGKTLLALYIAHRYRLYTCVLIENLIILKQWKQTAEQFFPDMKVCIVGKDRDADLLQAHVVLCMIKRVDILVDPERVTPPPSRFGLLIVDEVHSYATDERLKQILHFRPRYALGLSATPRHLSTRAFNCIELIFGPVATSAIQRKRKRNFTVHKVCLPYSVPVKYKCGKMDFTQLISDLLAIPERNRQICDMILEVLKVKHTRVLVVTARIPNMLILDKELRERGVFTSMIGGSHNTYEPNCKVLIAIDTKVGQGFDEEMYANGVKIKHPLNCIFFCSSFRAEVRREQLIGRVRSKEHFDVYHLVDNMSTLHQHYLISEKVYTELGATYNLMEFRTGAVKPVRMVSAAKSRKKIISRREPISS